MKITGICMKGAALLLLGLLTVSNGRSFAADIMSTSFEKLADSSADTVGTATTATAPSETASAGTVSTVAATTVTAPTGTTAASPFIDEAPSPPAVPHGTLVVSSDTPPPAAAGCDDAFVGDPGRFWFRGEYMQWWTSGAHVPPLVSTAVDPTTPGVTIFGDRDIRDGVHDGYRISTGMWLDNCHRWGIEGDYYDFQGRPDDYDSGLNGGYTNGNPFPIVRPFFTPGTGVSLDAVGYPSQYVGRVTVDTNDFFQSAGVWFRYNLRASEWSTNGHDVFTTDPAARTFRMDAIVGYRFARMIDYVNIRDDEVNINSADFTNYLTIFTNIDNFRTVNSFNGCELGLDTVMTSGRWSLDLLSKLAVGMNHQNIQLYGFAQSDASETGGQIQSASVNETLGLNRFSYMPELTATLGYQFTDHIKFTVAYDLIYWSEVARAGSQIATDPTTGLALGPQPTLTSSTVNESNFWAEGFRLGAEIRF